MNVLVSLLLAAVIQPLPAPEYADTEVSTNIPLGVEEGDDPVGLFATGALQEFGIESSGNCEVRKHANVIRREITGRVILNGVEMP